MDSRTHQMSQKLDTGSRKVDTGRRKMVSRIKYPLMFRPVSGDSDLNNLYGLVPPPGRRRLFWPGPDKGRRVSWTLFVNWFTWRIFRTVFGHKFRAGPPYNDQKWEPIYLFFLSAKIRAQYIYFSTIFFYILGPDFVTILECHLFK